MAFLIHVPLVFTCWICISCFQQVKNVLPRPGFSNYYLLNYGFAFSASNLSLNKLIFTTFLLAENELFDFSK